MAENTIQWDKDDDGIVTLTLDDPTGSANVMNEHYSESMHNAVERLAPRRIRSPAWSSPARRRPSSPAVT